MLHTGPDFRRLVDASPTSLVVIVLYGIGNPASQCHFRSRPRLGLAPGPGRAELEQSNNHKNRRYLSLPARCARELVFLLTFIADSDRHGY